MESGVVRIGNMYHEKGSYQKIRCFRDVDMVQDGKFMLDGEHDIMKRYFKWWMKKRPIIIGIIRSRQKTVWAT